MNAADITGTAVDGSGRPLVRLSLKRLSDAAFWSPYGWSYIGEPTWLQGSFPGGDGGSQVQWIMDANLPGVGTESQWCLSNGDYELTVEARDIVGNVATTNRTFTVAYTDPFLASAPEAVALPSQEPIGPSGATIGIPLLTSLSGGGASDPREIHSVASLPSERYGIVGSQLNQSLPYGYSTRVPILLSLDANGLVWQRPVSGSVQDGPVVYERVGNAPTAAFGADGGALVASGLLRQDISAQAYRLTDRCELVRIASDGTVAWTRILPATAETVWPGGADVSFLDAERVRLLPDGSALAVFELEAHDRRPYYGFSDFYQTNFRTHVILMSIEASGTVQWVRRFGVESEDERQHINETFRFLEPDGHGHLFIGTRRTFGDSAPEQVLRKIRLSDGLTTADHVLDRCESVESWGALAVDATGRPLLAGAIVFAQNDARLFVKRLSANELIPDWQFLGPAQSAYDEATWGGAPEIPLLSVRSNGITIVHNSPGENASFGSNGGFGDSNDRILVTRLDLDGGQLWTRVVNVPNAVSFTSGSRASFARQTAAGDVLLTGDFATGGSNWIRGYAKVADNGDYQLFKDLADGFDLSYPSFFEATLAATGDRLATVLLRPNDPSLQLKTLDNPANVVVPPNWVSFYPEDVSVTIGDSFHLEVPNTGSLATFQWYRDSGSGTFEAIPGATAYRYLIATATADDAGRYRVVATNSAGETTSREATVTVATEAPIITSALTASAYTNEFFFYQINATGAPNSYTITFDPENYPSGLTAYAGTVSGFPTVAGTFTLQISAANGLGSDTRSLVLTVADRPVIPLGQALDAPALVWTTADPPNEWRVQDVYTQVGTHALITTPPPDSSGWIEVSLTGPGTLSFWWHAFVSFGAADRLVLYLDGVERASINAYGYVQDSLEIPTGTHTVRWAMESGSTGDYAAGYLDGVSFTSTGTGGFAGWATQYGLSGDAGLAAANPSGDGIPNLLKYAFGLDPTVAHGGSTRHLVPGSGISGLPDVRPAGQGSETRLRVEFVRRKGASGLHYAVQFAGDLSLQAWQDATETPMVLSINEEWERVIVQDTLTLSQGRRRFARIEITEAP